MQVRGHLIAIGSIANLIAIEQAARYGVPITFRAPARAGRPITPLSMLALLGWI